MSNYIALLRGINVGGNTRMKMAELKLMMEQLGLSQVQTYIQSGNVVFQSEEEEEPLRTKLEQGIAATFGMSVSVVLRTAAEWERMMLDCPYLSAEDSSADNVQVALLPVEPPQKGIDKLKAVKAEHDDFRVNGRDIYLFLPQGVRDSKLAAALSKLGVPATARNWNTVRKLADMIKSF
ncbi:DUF1697 domain-containing protein [Gorillibacterium massiliense]|uniref:DUF1697 domain-containing protein n=1 Tax=Gorillibacterium massiliense TaxID=1280390 RepID=UPI0004B7AC2A|nr:DUF1697 domain-containing protein [Gorillibacterium massiliense]